MPREDLIFFRGRANARTHVPTYGAMIRPPTKEIPMSQAKQYVGSCHCGNVRYQVSLDIEKPMTACNCSMCGRAGTLLTFVPAASFKLEKGEDKLTDYQFNKKVIHHSFCSTCGVKPFARGKGPDGSEMVAVNARCLEGVDPFKLKINQHDGRSA
jgi:hypothetical protein